ncbi:hypothetical protein BESB_045760 [Besnoitia besnoiti]|uniref:Uncharacterized protein n=1 Tax=Besnoitia besnoiti TaxID=94643 RepID=A0A2A9MGV3_BESBE|nr:hypothetical protein BESB_045760 [Besnoitia besnoiti]PFH36384.1 hypothetical protein BESB_045760 [Besnoitia besnoiti]
MAFNRRTDCTHGNPVIGQRAWEEAFGMHQERLRKMKPQVDTRVPLSNAYHRAVRKDYYADQRKKMNDAFENFKMLRAIATTMNRPSPLTRTQEPQYHILNQVARRRELLRIYKQNQILLQRLEATRPVAVNRTNRDLLEHERLLANCSYSTRRLRQRAQKSPVLHPRPSSSPSPCKANTATTRNSSQKRSPLASRTVLRSSQNPRPLHQAETVTPLRDAGTRLPVSKSVPNLRSNSFLAEEGRADHNVKNRFRWEDYTVYPTSAVMGRKPHPFKESDMTAHRLLCTNKG